LRNSLASNFHGRNISYRQPLLPTVAANRYFQPLMPTVAPTVYYTKKLHKINAIQSIKRLKMIRSALTD
jgi:hypothetical protein